MEISKILTDPEYNFIKTDEHLGKHVLLLGLAGSYSYGTNNENSDIDVRGVALNPEHYLYLNDIGKSLITNTHMFLLKRAIQSFVGYAHAQLRRLQNALARDSYPLRDYKNIWNEMNNIVKDYDKIGKRNKKKDDNHLNKHAMHLLDC